MVYEPTEWKAGDVITGSKMNKIEAQLAANTEEIGGLKSAIPQENLFSLTNSADGWLTATGELAAPGAETRERTSEMIPVTPDNQMTCQVWVNVPTGSVPWVAYAFYNASFALMGSLVTTTEATSTAADGSQYVAMNFTVPTGAAYMRMSFRTFGDARAKLEVSSATTPYVINKVDYLEQQNAAVNKAGRLVDTATGNPVEIHTDETIRMPLLSVSEAGATSQDGTPTPSSPVAIEGLAGYDTMTVSDGVYTYSRSAAFDASADQYYAVQVEDGNGNTTLIGTTEKIAPLYEGDTLDFATGKVTRHNRVFLGSDVSWSRYSSYNNWFWTADTTDKAMGVETVMSDQYAPTTASINNSAPDFCCRGLSSNNRVYVHNTASGDNRDTFVGLVANAKFLIKLASPAESFVPMSSTMFGVRGSLVLSGAGALTVRYAANPATSVLEKIQNAGEKKAGRLVDTVTGTLVEINADVTIKTPLMSVIGAGITAQNGTPTPSNPVAVEGLEGYDRCIIYDGSSDEAWDGSGTVANGTNCFTILAPSDIVPVDSNSTIGSYRTNTHRTDNYNYFNSASPNHSTAITTGGYISFHDTEHYTTLDEFRAYISDHPIVLWYRSPSFDASADQYYVLSIESIGMGWWAVGTMEAIAPLYEGDSIDFTAGIVTRINLLTAHSNDDIQSTGSSSAGLRYFSAAAPGGIALAQTTESNPYPKCDRAVSSPTASVANSIRATQDGATVYYVYGTADDTDTTLREKFGGAKILLRRKNQVTETVHISSDLSGINGYLYIGSAPSGAGEMTVTYASDVKSYIDGKIAAVMAAIANL